jgi:hypothetical protein
MGSPRSDKLIAASVQWAEEIMRRIDDVFSGEEQRITPYDLQAQTCWTIVSGGRFPSGVLDQHG